MVMRAVTKHKIPASMKGQLAARKGISESTMAAAGVQTSAMLECCES